MSQGRPRTSVVIPSYNGARWIDGCLGALAEQSYSDFEVVVVDDGSTDDSAARVAARHPTVTLIELEHNSGFATAVNRGIEAARGEYVALLNNDTLPRRAWLSALVAALDRSDESVGAVAPKMLQLERPELVDDAGNELSWTGAAWKIGRGEAAVAFEQPREIFSPSAGASLYRRSFLERMKGFDPSFFAYLEDVDLGLRGRLAGYRFLYEPGAEVLHHGQGSGGSRARYVRWVTRNRLILLIKSIPMRLLFRHLPALLYGQLYFFVAYHRPLASLAGYLTFLGRLPATLGERRRISGERRLSLEEIDGLLERKMKEPPLRELVLGWLRRLRS